MLHRAAHAAVAADDEQDVDPELDEGVDHLPGVLVAARAAEDRAAVVVDVPHGVAGRARRRRSRCFGDQARVAVAEAVDVRDAVVLGELLDDPADHVVEPGAQAAAGHDADVRGVGVEVDPSGAARPARGWAAGRWAPRAPAARRRCRPRARGRPRGRSAATCAWWPASPRTASRSGSHRGCGRAGHRARASRRTPRGRRENGRDGLPATPRGRRHANPGPGPIPAPGNNLTRSLLDRIPSLR